jgi:hypothetical protein
MTVADGILQTFWNISHPWSVLISDDIQFHTALDWAEREVLEEFIIRRQASP